MGARTPSLEDLLAASAALPAMPRVVQELLGLLEAGNTSAGAVVERLSVDQVLSAKVLRLANSAYFAGRGGVASLDGAVRMLGFGVLRTLLVSASVVGSFGGIGGRDRARFWLYSLHTAAVSKYLAQRKGVDPELAFTVGLLHGVGQLVVQAGLIGVPAAAGWSTFLPGLERARVERSELGYTHVDVGVLLAERWGFPPVFSDCMRGWAEPLAATPPDLLHALVHIAAWRARQEDGGRGANVAALAAEWPRDVAWAIGLTSPTVLFDMPPLQTLCAGLESLLEA